MQHHILVVDDDLDLRLILDEFLTSEGYSVATAATGEEAFTRIDEQRPDLLLLDLAMPGKAGWDVIADAREAEINIPIVLMTGQYEAKMEAELCGAAGALAKPFELESVLAVVRQWTAQKAS
ncbi:MAG: response regulator [Dehalococcoidia bacterium]